MRPVCFTLPLALAAAAFAQPTPARPDLQPPADPAAVRDAKLGAGTIATGPSSLDKETREKGERLAAKAIEYLRKQQDEKSGGWGVAPTVEGKPTPPVFPAFSGLIVNGMLMQPGIDTKDPAVAKAIAFMLKWQQPDGAIYDRMLPVYNTSITLSAIATVDTDEARAAIRKGQDFLRRSQWGVSAPAESPDKPTSAVGPEHPFYGGWGYGRNSRPDISNLNFVLEALHDTGVSPDDPAIQRALVFLQRVQMMEKGADGKVINDQPYAKGSRQGGFIYATASDGKTAGQGQSQAGMIDETLSTGETRSMLRAYGSVSYAGFKSYLYAGLKKNDPRVQAVLDFCRHNYTVAENPRAGTDGQYYYYVAFARALRAAQIDTIDAVGADGKSVPHNWRADLINQLATMQNADGSFKSVDERWMEDNTVLITAYALLAAQNALR
ncbi:MAG TPA: prenyltransferase/squalene oxidase repeat-containing protein [Phycisphaerales bacterium]|nr:prenyltransferase/squalene oxidase repeat-containing protein [Phycisphaerales bacterium]